MRLHIVPLLLTLLVSACGTDTGNPFSSDSHSGSPPAYDISPGDPFPGEEPFTFSLLKSVCRKLAQCHTELSYNQCIGHFYELTNVDTEIGLTVGQYSNLQAVYQAEVNDEITLIAAATETCIEEFEELTCDDSVIINSYQSGSDNPLQQLEQALPTSCQGVF